MKYAEWRFDAVPQIMDGMNISNYVDPDIELKLRELEEEEAHKFAEMEAADMGGGDDNSDIEEEEEAAVKEIRERKRTMRNMGGKKE